MYCPFVFQSINLNNKTIRIIMKPYKSQNYGRELQFILTKSIASKRRNKVSILISAQSMRNTCIILFASIQKFSEFSPHGQTNEQNKFEAQKSALEVLTRPQVEFAARKFSKHLFRDPNVISSNHLELNSKKYKQKLPKYNTDSHVVHMSDKRPYAPIPLDNKENMHTAFCESSILKFPQQENLHVEKRVGNAFEPYLDQKPLFQLKSVLKSGARAEHDNNNRTTNDRDAMSMEDILAVDRNLCERQGLNYLPRRDAFDIGLNEIRESLNDSRNLDVCVTCLKSILRLLVVSGMILVVFILVLAINAAVFDFLREHFFQNALKFIFFLGAIMHSSVVGIYGLVALSKLNHVRPSDCLNSEASNTLFSDGCLTKATHFNLVLAGIMAIVAFVQLILLITSVCFMLKLFNIINIASPNEDDEDSSEEDEEDDFSYAVLHSAIHNLTTRINNISANTTLLNPATYLASITPNVTHSITIEDDDFDYGKTQDWKTKDTVEGYEISSDGLQFKSKLLHDKGLIQVRVSVNGVAWTLKKEIHRRNLNLRIMTWDSSNNRIRVQVPYGVIPQDTLSDDTGLTHHRSKRIANKPRRRHKPKPKNSKPKSDPWGNSGSGATATPPNSTEVEDDFADYPEGYFLKPGMTEAPENYEYSESKFNKPHLTNAEWKDQFTSRKRTYEIEKSKLDSIVPVKPPEAVKGILGDDLLR
ncbi:hypothetical protein Fcan01_02483 [Folsomia candida]|uniref:Uncharacterized protein n=1 Tax=Folsomia candida TaxID=158441 RepID=A0A226EVR3_FOLCA|nr:hypothetical protein Fcan01_02483 [Folsomia candida]